MQRKDLSCIKIRSWTPDDKDRVIEIFRDGEFYSHHPLSSREAKDAAVAFVDYTINTDLTFPNEVYLSTITHPSGLILVADDLKDGMDRGLVCGFITFSCKSETVAELKLLYVDEAYRFKGVGSKLLASAIENAKRQGYSQLELITPSHVDNFAIRFYMKHGFVSEKIIDIGPRSFLQMRLIF